MLNKAMKITIPADQERLAMVLASKLIPPSRGSDV
jgi:hypothetical protein